MNENKETFITKIKNNKIVQKLKGVKNVEILIAVIVCVVAIGLYLCLGSGKSKSSVSQLNGTTVRSGNTSSELESILSKIDGVGETEVLITYRSSKGLSSAGNGEEMPDDIIGIIVVSKASTDTAKAKILRAVQTATGVTIDKITIFEMG